MAVALYARVSTGRQAEKELSIPDQLRQMRDWCKRQGLAIGKEYVEPGVSATDDRRPQFQQMIADACQSPAPFEAIVVHSLSRFFRDHIESGIYQRKLRKFGVRLESISQPTGDDSTGWMVRNFFSIFDEYQSLENSKHTLRAMKENARQGFFNGSAPPFGYRKQPVDAQGRRGPKMRLIVDEAEAAVVRKIFKLYLQGERGMPLGMLGVANYLNERGLTRRGKPWGRGRVADVLRDSAYVGDYYFNKKCQKTGKAKPRDEWIKLDLEPIVDRGTFARASERRSARRPENVPPRVLSSPTLLTGIAKCGRCGASMTLATDKGGRYRYYKCTNRINKGARACDSRNVRMERLDTAVLTSLATQVLAPGRIEALLAELAKRLQRSKSSEAKRVHEL